jgi:ADP-heptose:LPS heptosyltransferase
MYSIPYFVKTNLETLPPNPIIDLPVEDTEKWNKILKDLDKPKVGIAWAGNSKNANDKQRSITLEMLRPILDVDCYFFALQKGERQKDIEKFNSFRKIHDVMNAMQDFYDTACFINELDLVIAVDTSTAHLAGLLNKPVWLLSKYEICWRWLSNRTDSPWYPSLSIYLQHQPFDWNGIVSKMANDLEIWRRNFKGTTNE